MNPRSDFFCSRRQALRSLLGGSLLMPAVLGELSRAGETAPRHPHVNPKAKRVIFLYMSGGVSHLDSFDPKPRLVADHGKRVPDKLPGKDKFLIAPKREFKPGGKCGTPVSNLFSHVRECMDDICLIRSMNGDHSNHFEATLQIHTGSFSFARPSLGSWVSYGLGTENQNLPSFVVLAPRLPYAGAQVWSADFLPGAHQGVRVVPGAEPIPDVNRRLPEARQQEFELGFLHSFNRKHLSTRGTDPALAARIQAFETAFGMQQQAPEAFDISKETDSTLALYGLERGSTEGFAWQCLIARRLAERGVRFIELIDSGASDNWDSHGDMAEHDRLARNVDQPIAGLLKDLKSRGMLEDTLVVWTTEFGRTAYNDQPTAKGREHHADVFTSWLAGAGVKGGITYGSSDDYGLIVAENRVHVHDFHATILHLLGINHTRLTFRHAGRDFRLTDVAGNVVSEILA
ncbi:MAG: DUF1501 domain-containing protein [Verrucomicrobiales bacterium]